MANEELLHRARIEGTPIIDGNSVTFVWEGEQGVALGADFCGWKAGGMVSLAQEAPSVWTYQMDFPLDAYLEYNFFQNGQRVGDPFNRRRTLNGLGSYNHYFNMPKAQHTRLTRHPRGNPPLRILTEELDTSDWFSTKTRKVHLWQPPSENPCPLLVVFDGREYLQRARLPQIVSNLIAEGTMKPLALALLENDPASRNLEYGANDVTVIFIKELLLPLATSRLNLINPETHPGAFGVVGASMGGLIALFLALRLPAIFGFVLSQAAPFSIAQYDMVVYDLVRQFEFRKPRVWLDCGIFDELVPSNRRMADLLKERGFEADLQEFNAGHNFRAWRDDIHHGLEWLFPLKNHQR